MDKETILRADEHLAKFRFSSKRYGLEGQARALDKAARRRGLSAYMRDVLRECCLHLQREEAVEDPAGAVMWVRRKLASLVIQNQYKPKQTGKAYW